MPWQPKQGVVLVSCLTGRGLAFCPWLAALEKTEHLISVVAKSDLCLWSHMKLPALQSNSFPGRNRCNGVSGEGIGPSKLLSVPLFFPSLVKLECVGIDEPQSLSSNIPCFWIFSPLSSVVSNANMHDVYIGNHFSMWAWYIHGNRPY